MSNNQECKSCKLETCPAECFNRHEGSMIALSKLARQKEKESGKKILVLDPEGAEVE
jgi:hypothetical protein